jgi:uncharacterized protein (UPF0264 family)
LLIDTFTKTGRRLFDYLSRRDLAALIDRAHLLGLLAVIGGSLDLPSLRDAWRAGPDYVAVRGAVCRGGRQGPLDRERVRRWVAQLAELQAGEAVPEDAARSA